MQSILFVAFLGLGLLQFAAIQAGLTDWLGLHWLIAIILAFPLAYMPVIGSILGVLGAVYGFGWSWIGSIALFFGAGIIGIAFASGSALSDWFSSRSSRSSA
jgi:hypothetical protein